MRTGATRELSGPSGSDRAGHFAILACMHYLKGDRIISYDPDQWTVIREVTFGRSFNPLCATPAGDAVAFVDFKSGMIARNLVVAEAASGQLRKVIPLPTLPKVPPRHRVTKRESKLT